MKKRGKDNFPLTIKITYRLICVKMLQKIAVFFVVIGIAKLAWICIRKARDNNADRKS